MHAAPSRPPSALLLTRPRHEPPHVRAGHPRACVFDELARCESSSVTNSLPPPSVPRLDPTRRGRFVWEGTVVATTIRQLHERIRGKTRIGTCRCGSHSYCDFRGSSYPLVTPSGRTLDPKVAGSIPARPIAKGRPGPGPSSNRPLGLLTSAPRSGRLPELGTTTRGFLL